MKISCPPYLRPFHDRLSVKEWLLIKNGTAVPIGDVMADWDQASNLSIRISVDADPVGIFDDCQLSQSAIIKIISFWYSEGTGLRGCGSSVVLDSQKTDQPTLLELEIEGVKLAGEVVVGVSLFLESLTGSLSKLSPSLPGSILWQESKKIVLEGTGTRFPIETIDFSKSFSWLPENAAWFLDWDRYDFSRPVLGSVRLFINTNHKRLKDAVNSQEEADSIIREAVYFDTARTMISAALESSEFIADAEKYPTETVGASIRRLLNYLFMNDPISRLALFKSQYPERFDCHLQDRLRIFWKD